MDAKPISIGQMRWHCQLANRYETPDPGSNLEEQYETLWEVYAHIEVVGASTFYAFQQVSDAMTHRIFFRWVDYIDLTSFEVILCSSINSDGSPRNQIFRVMRAEECGGEQRYVCAECHLESYNRALPAVYTT
jgi:hypothetical protein